MPVPTADMQYITQNPTPKDFNYVPISSVAGVKIGLPKIIDPASRGEMALLGDLCLTVTYRCVWAG